MITTQQVTNRLYEEWKTHGKVIVSVDFDDTIYPYKTASQKDCDGVIHLLKECKQVGAYITIFTACNQDRLPEIEAYCKAKGLEIDSINRTPIDLPYGKQGSKIFYNINICDRSGLNEALSILQNVMTQIRSERNFEDLKKLNCIDP